MDALRRRPHLKKNVLLFVVPVALLGLLAVVWTLVGTPTASEPSPDAPVVSGADDVPSPDASAPVTPVAEPDSDGPRHARGGRSIASDEAGALTETFPLDDALWIEGRVLLPSGMPPEPELEVVVLSLAEDELEGEAAREARRWGWLTLLEPTSEGPAIEERPAERDEPAWSRRPVAADGAFRAPCRAGSHTALVMLKADYLRIEEPLTVELREDARPIELAPTIGARMILTVVPPATADPEALAELPGTPVSFGSFTGTSMTQGRRPLPADLVCPCPQLAPDGATFYGVETTTFVPPLEMGLTLEAGRDTKVEVELELGARLAGTVRDARGAPIAGASVSARTESGGLLFRSGGRQRTTETALDGTFVLRAVRPGKTELTVTHEDYRPEERTLDELVDGEVREGLAFTLDSGERVAGVVRLPSGEPAPGATIRLRDTGEGDEHTDLPDSRKVQSEDDGSFAIRALGVGPFALRAVHRADAGGEASVFKAYVEDVVPTAVLTLRLAATVSVPVEVRDDVGTAIEEFTLRAEQADVAIRHFVRAEYTEGEALVELGELVPGRWSLTASGAGHTPSDELEFHVPHDGPPLVVTLPRAATLTGTVVDPNGRPVAGAEVTAELTEEWRHAETGDDGSFRIEDVTPGAVKVHADAEDWAPSDERPVDVASGQTVEQLVLSLNRGGSLSGEVFAKDGTPAANRMIQIEASRGNDGGSATSDADGTFEVPHLQPGTYQVIAMPDMAEMASAGGYGKGDIGALLSELETATATIVEGETTHVVLGAPPADPVHLSGRVTVGGAPLAGGFLAIAGEDRSLLDALDFHQTDDDGRYDVVLDEPGNYTILVSESMEDERQVEFNVTIPAVEVHELDFVVPLGVIRGRVVDPTGRGLANHSVSWERAGALTSFGIAFGGRSVRTDDEGEFEVTWLQPGEYTLRAGASRWANEERWSTAMVAGIRVGENEIVEGIEIALSEAGRVVGRVVDDVGEPVDDAWVWIRDENGRIVHPDSHTRTNPDGSFEYGGVAPGPVTVLARSDELSLASDEVGPVSVLAGDEVEVELALAPGAYLEVGVEDEEGELIRTRIDLVDRDGRVVSGLTEAAANSPDQTLSSTTRRLGPLPPGRYRVIATDAQGNREDRPVTLRAGHEKTIRLRFKD